MTTEKPATDSTALPEANFLNFLSGLATQALIQLGAVPHPETQERSYNIPFARYTIDILRVLQEKTDGNRTEEEQAYLSHMIADLEARLAKIDSNDDSV